MRYLFFDIECANCYDGEAKICEFGYVLTDTEFNVLEKESIKINPRAPFDKKGFAMRGIKLEKPYDYYYTQPDFKYFYEKIKGLLTRPGMLIVGHGICNDAKFLNDECYRYKLNHINFEYCDTMELAKLIFERERGLTLEELYNDYCASDEVTQNHRADEDAVMTMELAKFYTEVLKMPLSQVISNNTMAVGENFNGRVCFKGSPNLLYARKNEMCKKNAKIIETFIQEEMAYKADKTYVLPKEWEKNNFYAVIAILRRLKELKLLYANNLTYGYTYVLGEGENKRLDAYYNYQKGKNREPKIDTITFSEFLSEIGLSESDLQITPQEVDEIIGGMKCNANWYKSYKSTHSLFYKVNDTLFGNEFECSADFPVIQYVVDAEIEQNGEIKNKEYCCFYDYVLDRFYIVHPYRVNRVANSYLNDGFYKKARARSVDSVKVELARLVKLPASAMIKKMTITREYQYITSYKFKGEFVGDALKFTFTSQILADDDFKTSSKVRLRGVDIDIEKCIKELYDEKFFATALTTMAKFRYGYKDKSFSAPTPKNRKYCEGDEILLPKEYYQLYNEGKLDDSYITSLLEVKTDLFKKPITLPVLVKRTK